MIQGSPTPLPTAAQLLRNLVGLSMAAAKQCAMSGQCPRTMAGKRYGETCPSDITMLVSRAFGSAAITETPSFAAPHDHLVRNLLRPRNLLHPPKDASPLSPNIYRDLTQCRYAKVKASVSRKRVWRSRHTGGRPHLSARARGLGESYRRRHSLSRHPLCGLSLQTKQAISDASPCNPARQ